MRRFVRIKKPAENPQSAILHYKGEVYCPVFLHSTIDQDRAVGSHATFSEHIHDFYHVVLYTKGQGWYFKEGRYWPAQPGTCVLIHPGQRHEFVTRRQSTIYSELTFSYENNGCSLRIAFDDVLSLYSGMQVLLTAENTLAAEERQTLYNMMIQITDYLNSSTPSAGYYAHRSLAHILDFLIEHCTRQPICSELTDDRFAMTRSWLEQHYLEPISVDELAKMTGVTKSYFFRAFKKTVGMPPLAYQQMLRIEAAKTLLRATSLNCGQIASRAGFTDVYFFHRIFKKHTGLTPRQFRRSTSSQTL